LPVHIVGQYAIAIEECRPISILAGWSKVMKLCTGVHPGVLMIYIQRVVFRTPN